MTEKPLSLLEAAAIIAFNDDCGLEDWARFKVAIARERDLVGKREAVIEAAFAVDKSLGVNMTTADHALRKVLKSYDEAVKGAL